MSIGIWGFSRDKSSRERVSPVSECAAGNEISAASWQQHFKNTDTPSLHSPPTRAGITDCRNTDSLPAPSPGVYMFTAGQPELHSVHLQLTPSNEGNITLLTLVFISAIWIGF